MKKDGKKCSIREKGGGEMENHRQFFRIRLFDEPVIVQHEQGFHEGIIRDVSGNGMSFYLAEDMVLNECVLEFALKEERYILAAKGVRKEKIAQGEYVYACTFLNVPEKTQSSILSTLLRLDAVRRKK